MGMGSGTRKGRLDFWEQLPHERKKTIAYHVAGQAAMHFFFCSGFYDINMRGNHEIKSMVREPMTPPELVIEYYKSCPIMGIEPARSRAMTSSMEMLGGPCAENMLVNGDSRWLDRLYESHRDHNLTGQTDLSRVIRYSRALYGDAGMADRFIRRMATWTQEALSMPRLWGVVESLAERLINQKTMSGDAAYTIMGKAWGDKEHVPYCSIKKWRRRVFRKMIRNVPAPGDNDQTGADDAASLSP